VDIKQEIISLASELGFAECRVSSYRIMENEAKHYQEWLDLGYNADMKWMESNIDKRKDISLILNDVKSIISLAHPYFTENHSEDTIGKIARYAWGKDYHNVLSKKLKQIVRHINSKIPESKSLYYTDTGPILERQWAENSGIGWQGKNSLILNRKLGSYFFISTIITNIELEPDKHFGKDYCGTCTKCIDACPTQAIVGDKLVDANKCISYWTIESKQDEIPSSIANNLNGWVFGCDICQEVCPWNNHRVKPTIEALFYPRNNEKTLNLNEIENMSLEDFNLRFAVSPIRRTKLSGIIRNAKAINKKGESK
jgi:epoxyqueuosine reductase